MNAPTTVVAAVIFLAASSASSAGPTLCTSATASWEGNITRSPDPDAVRDAMLYDASGSASWRRQLSRNVSLQFGADAGFESCPKFVGLDRVQTGVQGSIGYKFGLGPLAPSVRAELSYTGDWYRESLHNGTRLVASLTWTKRWTEELQTVLGAESIHNDGRAPAYDFRNRGLSLEANYDLTERWQLSVGAKRQWGEQVTYAWFGGSGADFPYAYATWKNTTEVTTFGRNWDAYSIAAHADSVWIAVSPALGRNRALPLRFEQTAIVGTGESYRCRLVSLSFVQRF